MSLVLGASCIIPNTIKQREEVAEVFDDGISLDGSCHILVSTPYGL